MRPHRILGTLVAASFAAIGMQAQAGTSTAIFAYSPSGTQDLTVTTSTGTVVIAASEMGWYDQNGNPNGTDGNYIAGICGSSDSCFGSDLNYHDWFVFNLSDLSGTVLSASLSIGNGSDGYINPASSATYSNYALSVPIGELGESSGVGIYDSLGSGTLYASTIVDAGDNGTQVTIDLDAAALADLQADEGSMWGTGGAVLGSPVTGVPEPDTFALLAAGLLGFGLRKRRIL